MGSIVVIAITLLKVALSLAIFVVGAYAWGALVLAVPYRMGLLVGRGGHYVSQMIVSSNPIGFYVLRSMLAVGTILATLLAFWMHADYYGAWMADTAHSLNSESETLKRVAGYHPSPEWRSPADLASAIVFGGFLLPMLGMYAYLYRRCMVAYEADELERAFRFVTCMVILSVSVNAALVYTPLGGLLVQGLNAVSSPNQYLGVVLAWSILVLLVRRLQGRAFLS